MVTCPKYRRLLLHLTLRAADVPVCGRPKATRLRTRGIRSVTTDNCLFLFQHEAVKLKSLVRLPTLPSPSLLRHPHSVARWGGLSSRAKQPKIKLDKRSIPNARRTDQEYHNLGPIFAGISPMMDTNPKNRWFQIQYSTVSNSVLMSVTSC